VKAKQDEIVQFLTELSEVDQGLFIGVLITPSNAVVMKVVGGRAQKLTAIGLLEMIQQRLISSLDVDEFFIEQRGGGES
jgi:hypothetical protein